MGTDYMKWFVSRLGSLQEDVTRLKSMARDTEGHRVSNFKASKKHPICFNKSDATADATAATPVVKHIKYTDASPPLCRPFVVIQ